jgi:hypothetical protein
MSASPPRAPGSGHRFSYESSSGKLFSGDPQLYHGFRVSSTSHADVLPTLSATDYLRLPDVSPPALGSGMRGVIEHDDVNSPNPVGIPGLLSPSIVSPSSSKKKMGTSSIFRQPDVSPPALGSGMRGVIEHDDVNSLSSSNPVGVPGLLSPSIVSPSSSKKKMGMSSMFRQQ